MSAKRDRPGMMIYFELVEALALLTDEQRGKLLYGALLYARDGAMPDFDDPMIKVLWPLIDSRIRSDSEKYAKTCLENALRRRYGLYKAAQTKNGEEPLPFEEWRLRVEDEGED